LLISQDAEWGLSMRLDSVMNFPRELMLGAADDPDLVYAFGKEMARECKRIGVNWSFSPVVDINSNPLNPIIGDRSFGEDKFMVANLGLAYMRGLQENGVIACAKHFPGHGNTDKDSHKTLPVVNSTREEIDTIQLFPFKELIDAGVGSVMTAHLSVPALDTTEHLPSDLSPKIVTGLLRNDLGFHGLVITDALNMKGVTDYFLPGVVDVTALLAGNDMLLFSQDVPTAVQMIKDAVAQNVISEENINIRVRKILQAKYWCGLNHFHPIELKHLQEELTSPQAQFLRQRLIEKSLTLVRNINQLIPIQKLDTFRFAAVAIGDTGENEFQEMLSNYAPVKHFSISRDATEKKFGDLLDSLKPYNAVFISLHRMNGLANYNYGVRSNSRDFISELQKHKKVFLTLFGTPYALQYFESAKYVLEAYNDDPLIEKLAAQVFFGGIGAQGHLPVSASSEFFRGIGITTVAARLKYSLPEDIGISSEKFKEIDKIANEAIDERATPGCEVFVVKDGKVIWDKSYGNFTYDVFNPVMNHNLYDLASVTKIAATTLMVMKLYEENKLDLKKCLDDYLPEFKGTNKAKITLHELLTHEGGLIPYIPFYKQAFDTSGKLSPEIFSYVPGGLFTVEVPPRLYMNRNYIDTIWQRIKDSPVGERGKYLYSDLDFYFLRKIAEKVAGIPLDQFVYEKFYAPLGLSTICFNPLRFFPKEEIVPSNYDYTFRKDLLQGTVHDQGAAMMGGISGHAGLFSDASDLGTLMQMLLNNGEYAGIKFFDSATVKKFTSQYSTHSRRGLGFDKQEPNPDKGSPCCKSASIQTFGHQGFTGTCVWVDPKYNLIYVFLSNRTFPDDANEKLNNLSIRTRIQQAIYDAIMEK
ncbi:MAG TPA: glycoside hydrolase family 3 N-terminal domain-containing protein, partial [Chitinophagales bacterium]|nr:glycoside hydrolase family 3 N-terminal domain-containing protein [Chitinophagales bacterium]